MPQPSDCVVATRRCDEALLREADQELCYVRRLLDSRKTLSQHRELFVVTGWLSLLVGCLYNDMGNRGRAEAARAPLITSATKLVILSSCAGRASWTAGSR